MKAASYSIVRRFQFCAGHRVYNHESKCAHPHGHNYVAFITIQSKGGKELDDLGRVIDFSVVKEVVGKWIDDNWDHGFIYYKNDIEMEKLFRNNSYKSYAMELNPTAENMARVLQLAASDELAYANLECTRVELWETENCKAIYDVQR